MDTDVIKSLIQRFEDHAQKTTEGIECWLARDFQELLGYTKWGNFYNVIEKAKNACEASGEPIENHFADVGKKVFIGYNVAKQIPDMMLTRYACYLIAQNGDSKKEEIAFAQTYFAVQTRKMEIIEQRLIETERVQARKKLAQVEKELSSVIFEFTKSEKNFGLIRTKGDHALFNRTTEQMKHAWKVPKGRALADFAPTIILKAKDFATEITIYNTRNKRLNSEWQISNEHITNNRSVRKTLIERGIQPETLPPDVDVQKIERKLTSEVKKTVKSMTKGIVNNLNKNAK